MSGRVIVIGASGQGRQVIDVIEELGGMDIVGVLDRGPADDLVAGYPVIGSDDDLGVCAQSRRATGFVVAIGDNFARHQVLTREIAQCPHLEPYCVVHPSAVIARSAAIGSGSLIMAGAVVGTACRVGVGALMGTRSSLDHDCVLGDGASLAPGVTTGGGVRIGECTALGVGASVIHGVDIGCNSVVGAGAVVLEDVPDHVVSYGVPARVVKTRDAGEPYLTGL